MVSSLADFDLLAHMAPNSCFCFKSPQQSKETRESVMVPVTKESEGAVVQVRSAGEEEAGLSTIGGLEESFQSRGWRGLVLSPLREPPIERWQWEIRLAPYRGELGSELLTFQRAFVFTFCHVSE